MKESGKFYLLDSDMNMCHYLIAKRDILAKFPLGWIYFSEIIIGRCPIDSLTCFFFSLTANILFSMSAFDITDLMLMFFVVLPGDLLRKSLYDSSRTVPSAAYF